MANKPTTFELQLTVAKLLELSYDSDEDVTVKLLREIGPLELSVDQNGNAALSGSAGKVTFSANSVIQELGVSARRIGISMSVDEEGSLNYRGRFLIGAITVSVAGTIDVEALILACSGLLCKAARALKRRTSATERQLEKALGQ